MSVLNLMTHALPPPPECEAFVGRTLRFLMVSIDSLFSFAFPLFCFESKASTKLIFFYVGTLGYFGTGLSSYPLTPGHEVT